MVWLGCRVHRSSFNSAGKILGVDRLLHPTRPCLNMRENTEPSSHDPYSRFFLVDTWPEHHDVAIGIRDVEQDGVLATGVNQSWNRRLGTLQALDHFPIERMRIQVNRRDGLNDLGFLGPSQTDCGRPQWGRRRPPRSQTWRAFLENHVSQLVSVDFFVVPTLTFRVLFVFVVLAHDRRQIMHVNVTGHPTAQWTAQQIRNAFPWDTAPRYLLRDRDGTYGPAFRAGLDAIGSRTSRRLREARGRIRMSNA